MTGIFKINNNEIIDSSGKLTSAVFPANTIEYITVATYTSTQSNTNDTTTFEPAGITLTVPSATVTKYSKLKITFSLSFRFQDNARTWADWKIERSNPTTNTLHSSNFFGIQDPVTSLRTQISGVVIDSSLGTGDHTYRFYARRSASTYAGTLYLDGSTDSTSWMLAEGII